LNFEIGHSTVEDDVRDNGHDRHWGKVEGPVAAFVEHMNGSGWQVKMKTNEKFTGNSRVE